jgi:DNA-binding IclR family transcriptional regulator
MTNRHFLVIVMLAAMFPRTARGKDRLRRRHGETGAVHQSPCGAGQGTGQVATPKNHSVMKAFAILKAFRDPEEWVTSCELSRRAQLPEASGYRLIQTLEDIGAVVRGPRGRYRTGLLLLSLSRNVTISELLRDAGQALMTQWSERLNLTMHLGVLEHGMVTYVAKVAPPGAFPVYTKVGVQLESYCSGLGKVLLAALSDEQMEGVIMDGALVALTPYTITSTAALRAELKRVLEQGYALDDRENHADMRCIAVPVLDRDGRAVAALSASDNARRMTPEWQMEVRDVLFNIASSLRQKLYPLPAPLDHHARVAAE